MGRSTARVAFVLFCLLATTGTASAQPIVATHLTAQDDVAKTPADSEPTSPPADTAATVPQAHPQSPQPIDTVLADIAAVGLDAVRLFSAPARFGAREWAIAFGGVAVWSVSFIADIPVRDAAIGARSSSGDRIARLANSYGTPEVAAVISGGTWLTGLLLDMPEVRRAGRHAAQAVVYSGIIATAAKWLVGRERPAFTGSPTVYVGPQSDDRYYSLPSGHATLAFAISSSLASDIDNPFATVALYGIATTTALSRIYVDRHWTSDVVIGALIGTACGWGVATLDDGDDARSSWMLVPSTSGIAVLGVF